MALKAARAAQRLQIPPSELRALEASDREVEGLLGTNEHWLGIPPSSILPPLSSITDQQKVVQTIKVALEEWAAKTSSSISQSVSASKDQNHPSPVMDLVKIISDRKESMRNKRIQSLILTKKILRDTASLLILHKAITDKALAFAEESLLIHQPKLDQRNIDYDLSWTKVMEAKIMAMEAQMELQTYGNPKHLMALSKVCQLITESKMKVDETMKQVLSKLDCYQALGPAFEAVAAEYGKVLRQLHETQGILVRLREMETDLSQDQEMNTDD